MPKIKVESSNGVVNCIFTFLDPRYDWSLFIDCNQWNRVDEAVLIITTSSKGWRREDNSLDIEGAMCIVYCFWQEGLYNNTFFKFLGPIGDIALSKPTSQVSTYSSLSSSLAVAGTRRPVGMPERVCSHTHDATNPWFYVDLIGYYYVTGVAMMNRATCCCKYISNTQLFIFKSINRGKFKIKKAPASAR